MTRDFHEDTALAETQVNALLDDIELRCSTGVAIARDVSAVRKKIAIEIRPGNAGERNSSCAIGKTIEVRTQGATCVTDTPITVGNVFHVTFTKVDFSVNAMLAVCDRCTMLGDASFEARFRFVNEIRIPSAAQD